MKFHIGGLVRSVAGVIAGGSVMLSAAAGPILPTGGGTLFQKLTTWGQNYLDFMTGPFATAAVVISALLIWIAWAFMPKEGIMANLARIVVAGFAILNIGTFCSTLVG
ncbi:hypothetical protein ACHMW6_00190 (plasmid) [Pseudoduganella sp. UC29_106]|uniref:hypothetical protein n=1 Tax=Pseudoduganella sp. UC29_106 TaxID=3374553 RepID=UPI0037572CA4